MKEADFHDALLDLFLCLFLLSFFSFFYREIRKKSDPRGGRRYLLNNVLLRNKCTLQNKPTHEGFRDFFQDEEAKNIFFSSYFRGEYLPEYSIKIALLYITLFRQ